MTHKRPSTPSAFGYKTTGLGIAAALLALGLGGCTTEQDRMAKEGYPPAYIQGYDDGCHSGKHAGGNMFEHMKKDVRRYDSDRQYAEGWDDGYETCEKEAEAMDRANQRSIEQQRIYQEEHHSRHDGTSDMARDALKGIDTRGLENLK